MTLMEINGRSALIDCGLYQGSSKTIDKNFLPFPFTPKDIEAVVITHAHLDHSGRLPYLVKKGFSGKIFCTRETSELLKIILADSASLNSSKEKVLYDQEDVKRTLKMIRIINWDEPFDVLSVKGKLLPAGHILGASSFLLEGEKKIIFSGDLGRSDDFLLPPPPHCPNSEIVVLESTYGGRLRKGDFQKDMMEFLKEVRHKNTIGVIASFALARGQTLITLIAEIFKKNPDLKVPIYFDSPMMKEVNEVYKKHNELTKLPWEMFFALEKTDSLDYAREWETLKKKSGPFIIISSSGMVTGGRIFRSLQNWQNISDAILFLVGYQGENTQGKLLLDGHRIIKDNEGNLINWTGKIFSSEAFSSHADQTELLSWVSHSKPKKVFLIHGDQEAKLVLKEKLGSMVSAEIIIPQMNDSFTL